MRYVALIVIFILLAGLSHAIELKIGLIPEQNVFKQVERYKPIGEYIEKRTGVKINFTILSRYGNIIERFVQGAMDGAFWGSFTGAMAIEKLGVEPIARPLWLDGTSTYSGYIFVRKDSEIRNVADMHGKTVAFVERATTAGYVFPLAYFREHGVRNIDTYFKEYYFAGSHDAVINAVLNKEADIGCAKNTIFELLARENPRIREELYIIARSPKVPSNCFCVKKELDPAIKRQLRDTLLAMDKDPEGRKVLKIFGAQRFIVTRKDDYEPVFNIAQKAGIDIKKYKYINR